METVDQSRPWPVRTYLAVIVAVVVVAVGAATVYGFLWSSNHARGDAPQAMALDAKRASNAIASDIAIAKKSVVPLAAQPGLDKAFGAKHNPCQLSIEGSAAFPSVRLDIVGRDGRVACTSAPSARVTRPGLHRGSTWLKRALGASGPMVVWDATDPATGERSVVVAAPVPGGSGAVALISHVRQTGSGLARNIGGTRHPSFTLLDRRTGAVVSSSEPPRSGSARWGASERPFNSSDVPGSPWRVSAGVRRSAVLAEAHGAPAREVLVGLVALLLLLLAVWLLNRRVAGPLRAISKAVLEAGQDESGPPLQEGRTAQAL